MDRLRILSAMLMLVLTLPFDLTAAVGQPELPRNATKRKLVVGVITAPPYSMQDENGAWVGITVDLWREIARAIDVDYELKPLPNLEDLLGMIANGTVDVGATGVSITGAREKEFDFSDPYLAATEAVAVNADQQPNIFQVFRSILFDRTALFLILVFLGLPVAGAAILWILEHKGDSEHYSGKTRKAFGKSLFWSTMVLSGKDFPKSVGWTAVSPATFAGRMFGTLWMILGILLVSLFTATAASMLTSRQLQGVIHSQDDLRHVTVGTVKDSVGHEYLKHQGLKCIIYPNAVEMLKAVEDHKCDAAVFNRHIMVYWVKTNYLNKIVVLHFPLRQDFVALPMSTGFRLKEQINDAMLRVLESKQWQTIVSRYLGNDWANSDSN